MARKNDEMTRRKASIYLLTQLTDCVVGNPIEDIGNKYGMPQIFFSIINLGYINKEEVESYELLKKRILNVFDVADKEIKFFYEVGKMAKRKATGREIFKDIKKEARIKRKLKKHTSNLII